VKRIRVLFSAMSPLLAVLLTDLIQRHADLEVVGKPSPEPVDLLLAVREYEADVVIMALANPAEPPGISSHLLAEYPDLLVLALSINTESGSVYYRPAISNRPVTVLTGDSIVKAIRTANM
jgi:DNA-binding transcriptional LysR family regulator